MKKPDALEKMALAAFERASIFTVGNDAVTQVVTTLLRQQYRKIRRMVQRTKKMTVGGFRDHVLAKLDRMAKGGR